MSIYLKLLEVQKEIPVIEKDAPNPFYKSKYATLDGILEVVKPILSKHGLVMTQPLSNINGNPALAIRIVEADTGEMILDIFPLMASADAQKQGGTITYTKRQSLAAFFCIQTSDDDDGNSLVEKPKPSQTAPNAPQSSVASETCKDCGTVKIMGKKGLYCKPCYVKWAESQKAETPAPTYDVPTDEIPLEQIPF